jgi:hypothetical protein
MHIPGCRNGTGTGTKRQRGGAEAGAATKPLAVPVHHRPAPRETPNHPPAAAESSGESLVAHSASEAAISIVLAAMKRWAPAPHLNFQKPTIADVAVLHMRVAGSRSCSTAGSRRVHVPPPPRGGQQHGLAANITLSVVYKSRNPRLNAWMQQQQERL